MRPVLVTGATGFTGGRLVRVLRERGVPVRALVREGSRSAWLAEAGVELVTGDLRDADAVRRAAAGVERIYHIAAVYRTAGHPDSYYRDVNVGGTVNVLEAARQHGVARVVHCSTVGVHGDVSVIPSDENAPYNPGDIYQVTKLEAEERARAAFAAGLPGAVVRPAGIYGPGDLRFLKLFKGIYRRRFLMLGSGETLYHLTYVDDLVEGILLCGEHPAALGQVYILCGDGYLTLNELAAEVARAVGREPPRWHFPLAPVLAAAVVCEAVCRPLRIDPPLHRRRVEFFVKDRAFTHEKARRELGWAPKVPLAEGIERTARWYLEQGLL
jgi:nucleoside-diphosphate-sugar epimerase